MRPRSKGRARWPTSIIPTGSAWSFSGSAGLAGNGSDFTAGNPNAPQGSQVAFLQKTGSISQTVDFAAAGSYVINFSAAQRGNFGTSNEKVQVLVDGTVVSTITPAGTSYATYTTASFNVTAGSHTITFAGVDPSGADYSAFLDQVTIDNVSPAGFTDPGSREPERGDGPVGLPVSAHRLGMELQRLGRPGGQRQQLHLGQPRRTRRAARSPSSRRPAR